MCIVFVCECVCVYGCRGYTCLRVYVGVGVCALMSLLSSNNESILWSHLSQEVEPSAVEGDRDL